eukprot:TRINITY_DN18184_c0_g1_i1.p1 TRINITY_DN18184_c0_g1~~TRINITY_DN18184_c0_g1_i1.p1  ORF type:complete len:176 (+),score=35.08 TRINITY_DN18184_c0_g1_i1:173-700(+)
MEFEMFAKQAKNASEFYKKEKRCISCRWYTCLFRLPQNHDETAVKLFNAMGKRRREILIKKGKQVDLKNVRHLFRNQKDLLVTCSSFTKRQVIILQALCKHGYTLKGPDSDQIQEGEELENEDDENRRQKNFGARRRRELHTIAKKCERASRERWIRERDDSCLLYTSPSPRDQA